MRAGNPRGRSAGCGPVWSRRRTSIDMLVAMIVIYDDNIDTGIPRLGSDPRRRPHTRPGAGTTRRRLPAHAPRHRGQHLHHPARAGGTPPVGTPSSTCSSRPAVGHRRIATTSRRPSTSSKARSPSRCATTTRSPPAQARP